MRDEPVTVEEPADDVATPDADAAAEADAANDASASEQRMVPVTESIRYRRRAQAAERELGDLRTKFDTVRQELDETRRQLDETERRRRIDHLLTEADAIDLDAARLLTEAAIEQMDSADVGAAVDDLRRHKPYLFRRTKGGAGVGAMPPRPRGGAGRARDDAAETAATTGNRRDLLRYLRLRRTRGA